MFLASQLSGGGGPGVGRRRLPITVCGVALGRDLGAWASGRSKTLRRDGGTDREDPNVCARLGEGVSEEDGT